MIKNKFHILSACMVFMIFSCGGDDDPPKSRTYRMGFQNSAPRFDNFDMFIQSLNMWTERADAAIISQEVPWTELLSGTTVNEYVLNNYKDLVAFYRSKNLELWIYIDPQNGLDRTSDAVALQQAGKSIANADMQILYRKFVIAMDSILNPEHLGLALETNLIRAAATPSIYNGVRQAANDAASDMISRNSDVKLSVSVQVDHAWGKLVGGAFEGIEQDFTDFPFIEELGLSSYPYFGFDDPEEIPINYYTRLIEDHPIQVFVSEGGWTSASVTTTDRVFISSPENQRVYFEHHIQLLNEANATAVFQLAFTDIDTTGLPSTVPETIGYFAYIGLVDVNFQPKPALDVWDDVFSNYPLKDD